MNNLFSHVPGGGMNNSLRKIIFSLLIAICSASLALTQGASNKQVADEIIAIVKAQWAADNAGNPSEAMKNIAEDYTEFNGDFATRLEGKALNLRLSEATGQGTTKTIASEMANEKVQVYGDVAILSYNYVGFTKDKDGVTQPVRAKSTRVYAKQGGKWMLVHANFGADPNP
jgi:ketosteroid isomerase-like protein